MDTGQNRMLKPLKVYIAGPYTAATEEEIDKNVNSAIDAAFRIFEKGHFPYIPHLTHFVDKRAIEKGIKLKWEDYISWDMVWAESCDALLYLGSSKGADLERNAAERQGKRIFYSLEEIPYITKNIDKEQRTGIENDESTAGRG